MSEAQEASIPFEEQNDHLTLVKVFRAMNFMETEAHLLASASVQPEEAQKLLSRGCTHALATRILI